MKRRFRSVTKLVNQLAIGSEKKGAVTAVIPYSRSAYPKTETACVRMALIGVNPAYLTRLHDKCREDEAMAALILQVPA